MPDFLDSLNSRQRAAACHENGGALVLAGAGTGKTRVLTSRIAWLTCRRDCPPRAILAVTFTNKAAKEMRRRVSELARFPPGNFAPGTFHGVCHRMLRIHAAEAGWDKNFQILDVSDQKTFVRRLQAGLGFAPEEASPADCVRYINDAKDRGVRAANIPASGGDFANAEALREIYLQYESACRRENKLDFAELLLSANDLLRAKKEIRDHYAARFRHILIDEFQDTSPLQYQWLKLLDSGDNCFFAVGDDDQSIYAFRGADPENMRRVQTDLRAREIIRLEQNYRSTGNILSAANALISANTDRLGKTLFTESGNGAPIVVCRAASDLQESSDIARAAKEKIASGMRADDIAVLYRTNAQSRLLEKAMMEYGIPYRIYGGTRFFDRLEIKHALAYLRIAFANDRDSLLRVINFPPRGIGKKTMESFAAKDDIFAALADSSLPKARAFYSLFCALRERRADSSLSELARAAVEESGLLAHYESREKDLERAANLREFVSAATLFEEEYARENPESEDDPLSTFLASAALESGESTGANGEAVNLLTAHAAKGLEFAIVHIAGLEEGMFPSSQSLDSFNPNAVEEERRLMYVALTRARKELFLHFADNRMLFGRTETRPRSRFLNEIPAALLTGDSEFRPPSPPPMSPMRQRFAQAKKRARTAVRERVRVRDYEQTNSARYKNSESDLDFVDTDSFSESDSANAGSDSIGAGSFSESGFVNAGSDSIGAGSFKYRPGEVVYHPKHGRGVVMRCKGAGEEETVQVAFKGIGAKTFRTALARLAKNP